MSVVQGEALVRCRGRQPQPSPTLKRRPTRKTNTRDIVPSIAASGQMDSGARRGQGVQDGEGAAVQKSGPAVDKPWIAGAVGRQHRSLQSQPARGARVGVKMPGPAHTQLNLLTKSYESRSVRVRGGRVSLRCVVRVRVSGLVHKAVPMQAWPLCKTRLTPQLLPHAGWVLSACDRLSPTREVIPCRGQRRRA